MAHGDDHDHEHDENCDHEHEEGELDPGSPRGQLNELLNECVEAACELLVEHGEFDPFALALMTDGELLHLDSDAGVPSGDSDGDAIIESLRASLKERRAELIATAIVADVTLEDEDSEATTAAIAVSMEHVVEEPVSCFLPYEIDAKNEIALADLVGEPGERHVFPAPVAN